MDIRCGSCDVTTGRNWARSRIHASRADLAVFLARPEITNELVARSSPAESVRRAISRRVARNPLNSRWIRRAKRRIRLTDHYAISSLRTGNRSATKITPLQVHGGGGALTPMQRAKLGPFLGYDFVMNMYVYNNKTKYIRSADVCCVWFYS